MRVAVILSGALLSLPLLLLTGPSAGADDKPQPSPQVQEKLGDKTVALLLRADRVEAFRIDPERKPKPDEKEIGGFPITSTGKKQDEKFVARLLPVLLNDKTYFAQRPYKCHEPGVAYPLSAGDDAVAGILCFKSFNLRVTSRDTGGNVIQTAFGNFEEEMYTPMVKLAKEAFPDDKSIQGLRDSLDK